MLLSELSDVWIHGLFVFSLELETKIFRVKNN
jgi:hypothetical protein